MLKISCFSYKGGAGRSTLAMNIVPFLADKLGATEETPLILVDMDIDSCGITYFLDINNFQEAIDDQFDVQDLFGMGGSISKDSSADSAKDHILFRHLAGVGRYFGYPDRAILCLPAKPGAKLGNNGNYDAPQSKQLQEFVEMCEEYDIAGVLLDSPVGDQLTATWSNKAANVILCCLRPTEQFREGTARFFDVFDDKIARNKEIIVIPNVVPTDPLIIREENGDKHYPEHAKSQIIAAFQDNIKKGVNNYDMSMLEGDLFGVPKIDRFMWRESVLRMATDKNPQELEALKSYQKIVDVIMKYKGKYDEQ